MSDTNSTQEAVYDPHEVVARHLIAHSICNETGTSVDTSSISDEDWDLGV